MPRPIVTFLSDFGTQDWFVGVVHGVVQTVAPEAHVVDLNHSIPPGHVARGAFILEAASADFPPETIHLAVVDPGVGTNRRALAVRARGQFYVGPDNGLLEYALAAPDAVAHALVEERWFRRPVSRTFHGRDIFAPVAGHITRGVPLEAFGPRVTDPVRLPQAYPTFEGDQLLGRVMFIDHFGNALTNLTTSALRASFGDQPREDVFEVQLLDRKVGGLAHSYGDAPVGTIVAIVGSSGRIEIAQVGGDVAARLGVGEGDPVSVRLTR
jgi:S-adenosyl-L-methionine hydrolase (adenosine-forming)